MKEEKIDELVKHFSEKESYPEILNTKVTIEGVDLSVHKLMETSFRKGLEINFENDVKEIYKFSYEPKFESDGLLGSYYIVVHHFADKPELCHYNGQVLRNQEGIIIRKEEVIGAIKVEIPYEAIKALEEWRELNFSKITLEEMANHIVYRTFDREDEEFLEYQRLKRKYEGLENEEEI